MNILDKKTLSPEEIAKKSNVPLHNIYHQLALGILEELEHTSDKRIASEIALDHLAEDSNYYTKLEQIDKKFVYPKNYNIFFDTEFYENGETIIPISFAFLKESGESLYLVNKDFDYTEMVYDCEMRGTIDTADFLDKNVLNNLNATGLNTFNLPTILSLIKKFIGDSTPTFWTSTGSYDWVLLCQMFGRMLDLPKTYPYLPMDTAQLKRMFPNVKPDLSILPFRIPSDIREHNALFDAYEVYAKYLSYKKYIVDNNLPIYI